MFVVVALCFFVNSLVVVKAVTLDNKEEAPVINLRTGMVRGNVDPVPGSQDVKTFLGIPYAEPPIGELRFASPRPAEPWSGVRDATQFGADCPHGGIYPNNKMDDDYIKSEDCLFLNVYRPTNNQTLPVMVWIHGGGLYVGSGRIFDGSALASYNDVIVVTINYRLGLLGFLNIAGTELKGNYGMLDQVLALKWVQENIGGFGGNPARVTIFGQSAGGSSVDLHILSPLSKGLFKNAIIESGFATSIYGSFTSNDKNKYSSFLKALDCNKDEAVACLRSKTTEKIVRAQGLCDFLLLASVFPVVTIDGDFLREEPRVLLSEGRFNDLESVVIGATKDEGDSKLYGVQPNKDSPPTKLSFDAIFKKVIFTTNGDNFLVKRAILQHYLNHTDPYCSENILRSWTNILTDGWYFSRAIFSANAYAKRGVPTYFYQFSHRSTFSIHPKNTGVPHFDEVPYVFGVPVNDNPIIRKATVYTDVERGLSSYIMRLWTTVAKHGSPHHHSDVNDPVTWPLYTTEKQQYLDIGLVPSVRSKLRARHMAFWNEFVPKLKESSQGRKEAPDADLPGGKNEL